MHDNKALFKDVRKKWQVTVFISEVSNYTGVQITALAAYVLSISTNEDKQVIRQMFSFAPSLRGDLKCIVYIRVPFNMQRYFVCISI